MIAYKLLRVRKDGTLGSLFIDRGGVLEPGTWLWAETHPTKGYTIRTGWHCLSKPHAPHLTEHGRQWYRVHIREHKRIEKPASQGGTWFLARQIKILDPV